MTGCGGETLVEREKGGFEAFGERDISGVVCREILTERPDSQEQDIVLMSHEAKVSEVLERHERPFGADGADRDISAKSLQDFEVQ